MIDQEDNINLGKNVFDDNNQQRKSWACLGPTFSRSLIVFLSQLSVILLIIFGCFWRIQLSKTRDESTVWVGFCVVQQDTFYPHQDFEQVSFYKKSRLHIIGIALRDKKSHNLFTIGSKIEPFKQILAKFTFFINTLRHFMVLCNLKLKISSLFKV